MSAEAEPAADSVEPVAGRPSVRRTRALLLWGLPLLVVVVGVYWYGSGGRYATTDNAYLKQDRVDVTPQISGDVREVRAVENQHVQPGQVVLVLDDTLLQVAKMRAEAQLASARVEVESLRAAYREKAGEVEIARRTSHYAVNEFQRQQELANRKLVPQTTLDSAERSRDIAVGSIGILELQLDPDEGEARRRSGRADRPAPVGADGAGRAREDARRHRAHDHRRRRAPAP